MNENPLAPDAAVQPTRASLCKPGEYSEERRRTARVRLSIPILVEGEDSRGLHFSEKTRTEVVTGHGGSLISAHELAPRTSLMIFARSGQTCVRVVGKAGIAEGGYVYGTAFLEKEPQHFWGVVFPSISDDETPIVHLECPQCAQQEDVHLDIIEGMVYDANRALARWCEHCHLTTLWRLAEVPENTEILSDKVALADQISTLKRKPRTLNERRHPRIPLRNARACITRPGKEDDVVDVHDLSRGGVRFSSFTNYQVGTWVRVAVPFTEGATNIFVEGRIVRTHARPCSGLPGEFAIQFGNR